jgi:hypothetical protein
MYDEVATPRRKIISKFVQFPQPYAFGTALCGKGLTEIQKSEVGRPCREWIDMV